MTRLRKTTRVLDGVIITVVVVLLSLVASGPRPTSRGSASGGADSTAWPELIRPGARLMLPGVEWSDSARNIFLLVSSTCPACNDSVAFYRDLASLVQELPRTRLLVAAVDGVDRVRDWAKTHVIPYDVMVELENPILFGFTLTPTLLLVDEKGVVTDVLLRLLAVDEESLIMRRLRHPDSTRPLNNTGYVTEIDGNELEHLMTEEQDVPVILDVRRRSDRRLNRREGAISIPMDELAIRAPVELAGRPGRMVVDCTEMHWVKCRSAGRILKSAGVENVSLLRPRP